MEKEIELKSEKVRNIIGKIPPMIVRIGIAIIFLVFTLLMLGSWYIYFPNTTIVYSEITPVNDNKLLITAKIPSKEISKIYLGQHIDVFIPNSDNLHIYGEIQSIDKEMYVRYDGAFIEAFCEIEQPNNFTVTTPVQASATVHLGKINLISYLMGW